MQGDRQMSYGTGMRYFTVGGKRCRSPRKGSGSKRGKLKDEALNNEISSLTEPTGESAISEARSKWCHLTEQDQLPHVAGHE